MDYKTILQKIQNDTHFIQWMEDRFDKKASHLCNKMIESNELSNEQEVLIRECLEAGGEKKLSGDGIYSDPYALFQYSNQEIYWVTCDYEIIEGYYNNITDAENTYYELLEGGVEVDEE